jgi:hypothetical protein
MIEPDRRVTVTITHYNDDDQTPRRQTQFRVKPTAANNLITAVSAAADAWPLERHRTHIAVSDYPDTTPPANARHRSPNAA